jgi:hypothetical protein
MPALSFFGTPEDIEAHYSRAFASPLYWKWNRPCADEQSLREWINRPRRTRRISLRGAVAQAKRAGVPISGATVKPDGSYELNFGNVAGVEAASEDKAEKINRWDEVLNRGAAKIALIKR